MVYFFILFILSNSWPIGQLMDNIIKINIKRFEGVVHDYGIGL